MISIRPGSESDVGALCALDLIARRDDERRELIQHAVAASTCFVAVADEEVIGYGVLSYTFYSNGFIGMLYVHADQQTTKPLFHLARVNSNSRTTVGLSRAICGGLPFPLARK